MVAAYAMPVRAAGLRLNRLAKLRATAGQNCQSDAVSMKLVQPSATRVPRRVSGEPADR